MKLVIAGVPRAGKTTYAERYKDGAYHTGGLVVAGPVRHTDDLIALCSWSDASDVVEMWFDAPGPWIIEGCAAVRALRKWLRSMPEGRPCDLVVWLGTPRIELSRGQAALAKGCTTVWREVRPELLARNVHVEEA